MSDHPTKDEMKAEMRASVAEVETKLVRVEGEINTALATIVGKLDGLSASVTQNATATRESRNTVVATIVTSAFAIAGLFLAMAVYGDAIFGRGMQVRDVVKAVAEEMKKADPPVQQDPKRP